MFNRGQSFGTFLSRDLIVQIAIIAACLILPMFFLTDYAILPFVMIAAVIGAILILRQPFLGLLFYLFIFYIRPQEIWLTGAVGLEKTLGIIMLVLTVLKLKLKDDFRFKITNIHIAILLFIIMALVNVATSLWISHSWELWIRLFRLSIVFFCIIHLIDNEKQFKFFIVFTIMGTLFHASSAVIRYYQGIREIEMGIERAFAMDTSYGDPNSLAATIVYTLPLIYYYFTRNMSSKMKAFLIITMLILLWCVILTGSRTGMAGLIVFGFLILWERKNKLRNFLLIGTALVTLAVIMPEQYQQRFISITDLSTEEDATGAATSARSRLEFMGYAFEMFLDRPIFGYGMGNFATAMGMVYDRDWYQSHTLPAQIISEMGIAGVIVFGLWVILLFANIKKLRRYFAAANNKFMMNMALAMRTHLFLLFFMGLGGHNLFRYNWFIVSAIIVMLMKPQISGYGRKLTEKAEQFEPIPQNRAVREAGSET